MKIAFVTPEYPHPVTGTSGGIGTSILNLAKGLIELNHKVVVIIYGQQKDEVIEDSGISIYRITSPKFKGLTLFLTQIKVQKLLNKLYKEKIIDIAEAPDWTGFTAFVKPKCPLILKLHGSDTYFCHLDQRPVKWFNKYVEKKAFVQANGIISVSEFTGKLTNQIFNLNKAFSVIPNAIDASKFEETNLPANNQTILYFGTLIRKKGMLELPLIFNEVYKKNKKARLILVGTNALDIAENWKPTWELMKPLFDTEAFQNVTYLGSVPYNEIKKIISEASICVFPTFAEALPVSWLEAMAMQKPIVASNIGWATEVINDGEDGLLEHPKNHVAFADKINLLIEDEALQHKLGTEARKKVLGRFKIKVIAEQSVAFYSKYV